jgi:hypothetical protein
MKGNRLLLFVIFCWFMTPAYHAEARYYDARAGRFLSVDPASVKYPGWSPYHYTLANPLRYIDPTGKWNAEYDKKGNIVTARAEKGDNLAGLYNQLGISAKEFGKKYDLSESAMSGFEVEAGKTTFNISSYVFSNSGFNADATGSNCFGFVEFATGKAPTERSPDGKRDFFATMGSASETGTPHTGDVAVWRFTGNMTLFGREYNTVGNPAHAGIFILSNQSGEAQYLNRIGDSPVRVSSSTEIHNTYGRKVKEGAQQRNIYPPISQQPQFFNIK